MERSTAATTETADLGRAQMAGLIAAAALGPESYRSACEALLREFEGERRWRAGSARLADDGAGITGEVGIGERRRRALEGMLAGYVAEERFESHPEELDYAPAVVEARLLLECPAWDSPAEAAVPEIVAAAALLCALLEPARPALPNGCGGLMEGLRRACLEADAAGWAAALGRRA